MTPSDPAATLEAIKERAKSAAAMDIDVLSAFNGVSVGGVIAASAVDVPSLVAALEAALKEHQPVNRGDDLPPICGTCHKGFWPCPTYLAITREITGKGGGSV